MKNGHADWVGCPFLLTASSVTVEARQHAVCGPVLRGRVQRYYPFVNLVMNSSNDSQTYASSSSIAFMFITSTRLG